MRPPSASQVVQKSAAGLLMEKELQYLGRVLQNAEHRSSPFSAARKSATKSESSKTCSEKSTP